MLTPMQQKLVQMMKWFHHFCVEHSIVYYAVGGTLLGAVRHQGFIPWDDDIDVVLPIKHYENLLTLLQSPVEHYLLESPYSENDDYLYPFSKLYDTTTTLTEAQRTPLKRGVYIDVFPLSTAGHSLQEAQKNVRKFERKNLLLAIRRCSMEKPRSWYKQCVVVLGGRLLELFIGGKKLSRDLAQFARNLNSDTDNYVVNFTGSYGFREICKREWFGTPTLYQFEDIQIYGPKDYDQYLTHVYGDWRKLPPESQRCTHHNFVELDLNHPYR